MALVTTIITPTVVIIVCLLKRLMGFLFQSSTDAAMEGNFQHNTGDVNPERPGWALWGRVRLVNPVQECASRPGARRSSACLALLHWITFLAFVDASHNCFPAPCNLRLAHSATASYLETYDSKLFFPLLLMVFKFLFLFWGNPGHHVDCRPTQALYEFLVMIQWSL